MLYSRLQDKLIHSWSAATEELGKLWRIHDSSKFDDRAIYITESTIYGQLATRNLMMTEIDYFLGPAYVCEIMTMTRRVE